MHPLWRSEPGQHRLPGAPVLPALPPGQAPRFSHLSRWSQWPHSSQEWGRRQGGGFSRPGCCSVIAHLSVSGAGRGEQPPPSAPRPSQGGVGETRAAPSLAGGVWSLRKEDTAKINCSQAVSPGNKPASHWLPVTSLLLRITWECITNHLCMCLPVGARPAGGAGNPGDWHWGPAQDRAGAGLSVLSDLEGLRMTSSPGLRPRAAL